MATLLTRRDKKGTSLIAFPDDYVLIDIETTGLDPTVDDIIELGAIRIENGQVVREYVSLVNPGYEIDSFISNLTGIKNDELTKAPALAYVLPAFIQFLGSSILVGHNINFDINFLYDASLACLGQPLTNDFVDTLRLCRRIFPERKTNSLSAVAIDFNLSSSGSHRVRADCLCTDALLTYLRKHMENNGITLERIIQHKSYAIQNLFNNIKELPVSNPLPDSPLYQKNCVFTGKLDRFTREDAMRLVYSIGGFC